MHVEKNSFSGLRISAAKTPLSPTIKLNKITTASSRKSSTTLTTPTQRSPFSSEKKWKKNTRMSSRKDNPTESTTKSSPSTNAVEIEDAFRPEIKLLPTKKTPNPSSSMQLTPTPYINRVINNHFHNHVINNGTINSFTNSNAVLIIISVIALIAIVALVAVVIWKRDQTPTPRSRENSDNDSLISATTSDSLLHEKQTGKYTFVCLCTAGFL